VAWEVKERVSGCGCGVKISVGSLIRAKGGAEFGFGEWGCVVLVCVRSVWYDRERVSEERK